MKKIYLAHPYGGNQENIRKAGELAKALKEAHPDWNLFSPLHNFSWETYDVGRYESQIADCITWLKVCDSVYFAEGWEYSLGCMAEMVWALKTGKMIFMEGREEEEMDSKEAAIQAGMENMKMLMNEIQKHRDLMRNGWEDGRKVRQCHMHARIIDRLLALAGAQNEEIRDLFDDIIDEEADDEEE